MQKRSFLSLVVVLSSGISLASAIAHAESSCTGGKVITSFQLKHTSSGVTLSQVMLAKDYLADEEKTVQNSKRDQPEFAAKLETFLNVAKSGFTMKGTPLPFQRNSKNSKNEDRYALDLGGNGFDVDTAVGSLGNEGTGLFLFISKDDPNSVRVEAAGDQGPGFDFFTCSLVLTETSNVSDLDLNHFLKTSLQAKQLAYSEFGTELVFSVKAFQASGLNAKNPLDAVTASLAKIGYGDLKPVELSDIDDQIAETVDAAYLADSKGVAPSALAKMEKLVDEGQRTFDAGSDHVRVYSANGVDSNHFEINALIAVDTKAQEVVIVGSQKSE